MNEKKLIRCIASAPGKIILHGEHAVVYGKTAIAASLDLRTTSVIKELNNDKHIIVINFPNLKLENIQFEHEELKINIMLKLSDISFTCETPEHLKHNEYLLIVNSYVQNFQTQHNYSFSASQFRAIEIFLYIYSAINKNAQYDFTPFELTVSSDLTLGSGIGSSASYAVSLAASILQYVHMKCPSYFNNFGKHQSLDNLCNVKFNEFDKNLISNWAYCCEKISHGNPSGVDNEICSHGSLLEFRKGNKPTLHKFTKGLKICLVNTHVERNTKDLVDKVKLLKDQHPDIVNNIMDACDNLAKLALKNLNDLEDEVNLKMCDSHFYNLSEFFKLNHLLLKTIGVSHSALEKIFEISNSFGFGSKLTGAGGGGYAIILIPPNSTKTDKLITTLKDNGFDVKLTSLGGEGVTINVEYV